MADLNNLLAELDDNSRPPEELLSTEPIVEEEALYDDEDDRENAPPVPPALAAAQERKFANEEVDADDGLLKKLDPTLASSSQEQVSPQDEDYARLKSLWIQETLSPELLPYNADTVSLEMELLEGQEDSIDKLLMSVSNNNNNESQLVAEITKLDAQRTQFILQDWLALRLAKIEDHALYNRQLVHRMSANEVQYLKSYGELLEKHLSRTVLNHLPQEAWKKLDEPEMVEEPDWDRFVFCRVMQEDGVEIGTLEDMQEHATGSCLIARYGAIQQHVLKGRIQLLM